MTMTTHDHTFTDTPVGALVAHLRSLLQPALRDNDFETINELRSVVNQWAEELRPCPECQGVIELDHHAKSLCTVEPFTDRDLDAWT